MISHDVTFTDYLRLPGVHFSTLKHMGTSPLHYRRACDHERADTPALRLGRLTHALILTPELPPDVAVFEGGTRRGKAWDAFRDEADAAGKLIVKAEELRAAERMRDAVYANRAARALLHDGRGEVTVTWEEELCIPGPTEILTVPCRARLDWLGAAGIVEVKTTRWAGVRSWAREVAERAYHVQLAHYRAGIDYHSAVSMMYPDVWWIVIEKTPPHDVAVYRVRREDIETGERLRLSWLRRVAECEASGRWPGVGGEEPIDFVLPDYAATEGLDDVDESGIEGSEADGIE